MRLFSSPPPGNPLTARMPSLSPAFPCPSTSCPSCHVRPSTPYPRSGLRRRPPPFICHSSKKKDNPSLTDQILDYIEGGPKLRKWYGAPDLLPKDGGPEAAEEDGYPVDEIRDAVLVTNGDSEMGQGIHPDEEVLIPADARNRLQLFAGVVLVSMGRNTHATKPTVLPSTGVMTSLDAIGTVKRLIMLSLILKRERVKVLVKDKRAAADAFGTYVELMAGDLSDKSFLRKALRGVRAIICPSNEGFLSSIGSTMGVQHVIILSQLAAYRGSSGLQALMNSKARKLAEKDEAVVLASGISYTIIRAGLLQDSRVGKEGFSFKEGVAAKGRLSMQDAALICVEALDVVPQRGLIFEVVNGEEQVQNWKERFASLIERAEQV